MLMIPGTSGHESRIAGFIGTQWQPLVNELSLSRLGSVHGLVRGTGPQPRSSILLAAHMDTIGLLVTQVVDGFLRVDAIGSIDSRILPGQAVLVHGRQELPGVIAAPPARLLPVAVGDGVVPIEYLLVDVGLSPTKVGDLVQVGDLVSFGTEPVEMSAEFLSGHGLDNRVSVTALTLCLQELQERALAWDVWAVASVQEEITFAGAATSAFQLRPDLTITIDTTFAKGPGADDWQTFALGNGLTLGYGPNIHPVLYRRIKGLAENLEIPYATEYLPTSSGTEGTALQVTAGGIPNLVLSIPIRYMHTPVEMVALQDIRRTARLLVEFIAGLDADFFQNLIWDE
jgi:putative aminopeptidase FrvX